jgi:RHS repeat-associated protein
MFHKVYERMVEKDHGHALLGSFFVVADGSPLTGSPVHLHNDCWDVGIFSIHNIKPNRNADGSKKKFPARLYVPSGVIMPIPWMRPVITNPVPSPINPLTALTHVFKAGFGKLKRKKSKTKAPKKPCTRLSKALHNLNDQLFGKSKRFKGMHAAIRKGIRTHVGHPVDVAAGNLFTDNEDFALPGPVPLVWERTWYSDSYYNGPMGHGWHHSYDIALYLKPEERFALIRLEDGRTALFDDIPLSATDKPRYNRSEKLWLHVHPDGFYYLKDTDNLIYSFSKRPYPALDDAHVLTSIANTNGFAIRFEYSDTGFLAKMTDSTGRQLTVDSDNKGRITAIHAPHPQQEAATFTIARYAYSEAGDMVAHTDALNNAMTFEYEHHLLVKEIWRNGHEWFFKYDGNHTGAKCIETWGNGNLMHYKLQYLKGQTIVTNSLGHQTTYHHKDGLVYQTTDPNGGVWQEHYNEFDELEWTTDPMGHQQGYTHDELGNVLTATGADGTFLQTGYFDGANPHLPTEAMDERGGKWQWEYNEAGNLIKRTSPLKAVTKFTYEDGLLSKIEDAAGAETSVAYDRSYNVQSVTAPNGALTNYRYDRLGNKLQVTNPKGAWQSKQYDLLSRVATINDFDSNVIQLTYDAIDNITAYRDKVKSVTYTYSGLWKLRSRTEGGATLHFKYDTEEQLRKVTNEQGLSYHFKLDPAGNIIAEIGFDGLTRTYERNSAGWVTKINRPAGRFTKYDYNEGGRITEIAYYDGSTQSYKYDKGALAEAINADAVITFKRDVLGRVVKEICNGHEVSSTYDLMSNRTHMGSSLGADIELGYDLMGDVIVQQAMGWKAETKRDEFGLEIEKQLLGGLISRQERDNTGRVKSHWVGSKNAGLATRPKHYRRYHWDINDQLKEIIDQGTGTTAFEHDQWGNLAKTRFNDGTEQLRNPDKVGNLFETKDRRDRKYDKGGKLLESKTAFYSYDEEGNLIEKKQKNGELWKYEWNAAGMLQKVIRPDKAEVTFKYDALGRRIEKRYKKTITKWVWDGNKPLHEWKEFDFKENNPDDLITWIFEEDSFAPTAKIKGEKKYSLLTDHLGTPIQAFSDSGEKVWERQLDSYGKVKMLQGDEGFCNYLYQGQTLDVETGLVYNRFRYYSPEDGIYISQDPIRSEGGYRLCSYVPDPNTWFDVFGLEFETPKTVKSAKGVKGTFSEKPYNFRIDTNKITEGEGGFHIHIYRGKEEVAKVMGTGVYSAAHKGKKLRKPSELPKSVTREIRKLVRNTQSKLKKISCNAE